jgi:hypothetical protein
MAVFDRSKPALSVPGEILACLSLMAAAVLALVMLL